MIRIVVLQIAVVVRDCEILFSVTKNTFDELIQLSEMFEQCISNATDNISPEEETACTNRLKWDWCPVNKRGDNEHTQD